MKTSGPSVRLLGTTADSCPHSRLMGGICNVAVDSFGAQTFHSRWEYEQAQRKSQQQPNADSVGLYRDDGVVVPLKPRDLGGSVRRTRPQLVKFYAPWCVHCQHMSPGLRRLALRMQDSLDVGAINCEVHRSFCDRSRIAGYPTLRLFLPSGDVDEFSGSLQIEAVDEWLQGALHDTIVRFQSRQALENTTLASSIPWILDFTMPPCQICHQLRPQYRQTAALLRGRVGLGLIDCEASPGSAELCRLFGVQFFPHLVMVPPGASSLDSARTITPHDMEQRHAQSGPVGRALAIAAAVLDAALPTQRPGLPESAEATLDSTDPDPQADEWH